MTDAQGFTLAADVAATYDETLGRVRDLLGEAGFGVLTEIDLAATLRAKLGVEVPPRTILGACRPQLAHQAMLADPRVATLLPCNVVVAATGSGSRVEVFDPAAMTGFSPALAEMAADARERLTGLLAALTRAEEAPGAARP